MTQGATGLGNARGSITIDTSQAQTAAATMRGVGQSINQSMTQTATGVRRLGGALRELRGEIAAVGIGAAVLTGLGLKTAGGLEEAKIQLTGIVGNERDAVRLMEDLRKSAAKAGVPFSDILAFTNQLLPALKGNTTELERYLDLARRLATRRPSEGLAGAAFSINEALSSGGTDLMSIAERFGIARKELRAAVDQTGSFAAGLDLILNRMGATTEVADRMGKTFNASLRIATDAARQLLATGFEPLLNTLTPLLQQATAFLTQIQQTSPALASMGAGLIAATAVAAPLALVLNQAAQAAKALKAAGILTALGRGGVLAGAGVAGGAIGIGAARGIGFATGNEAMQNTSVNSLMNTIRQLVDIIAAGIVLILNTLTNGMAQAVRVFLNGAASFRDGFALLLFGLGKLLPDRLGGNELENFALDLTESSDKIRELGDSVVEHARATAESNRQWLQGLFASTAAASPANQERLQTEAEDAALKGEQTSAIVAWSEAVQEIERDAAQARLDATRQYEQQRADVIAQYELSIVREAQDFARQRLRQQQQLEESIADIRANAAEREADWWADLQDRINDLIGDSGDRIADIRKESTKRVEDIEQDHAKRMEDLQRSHRETILNAASRLDARAIAEENRRFNNQAGNLSRDLAERTEQERGNLQERIEQEQENLAERIQQEQEAHAERLQDAREADEERIQDMRQSIAEQQRMEDEDRAIRLERQAEDQRRQLAQMATAHQDRLAQITQQAARERQQLDNEFVKQLAGLGIQNQRWLSLQKRGQDDALKLFEAFWDDFEDEINKRYNSILSNKGVSSGTTKPISNTPNQPVPFASGGAVSYTGAATVHGSRSRPEYMLSADTTAALRGMMGNFTQPQLLNAVGDAGGRGGATLNLGDGAIQIYAAPGMSPGDVAMAVRSEMTQIIRELA
jgi:hypothetical protein